MTEKPTRKALSLLIVASAIAILFLGIDTTSSVPSVPTGLPDAPDLEEIAMLEEIADWVVGPASEGRHLDSMVAENLTDLIREKPQSFELFRSRLDEGAERELLHNLPYGDAIEETAVRHRVDGLLLAALVEAESSFLPDAVSPVGAVGLTQVMPATARWLGERGDLKDPDSNLDVGARYLSRLIDQFDGDLQLALAAYNAGPGAVKKYGGIPPFQETRRYVTKVLSIYADHNREIWESTTTASSLALD